MLMDDNYTKEQVLEIVRENWGRSESCVLYKTVLYFTFDTFQIFLSEDEDEILYEIRVAGNYGGLEVTLKGIDENGDEYNLGFKDD